MLTGTVVETGEKVEVVINVTDDMIEAGASALALHREYNPNLVPPQLWAAISRRYRAEARAVLEAALEQERA